MNNELKSRNNYYDLENYNNIEDNTNQIFSSRIKINNVIDLNKLIIEYKEISSRIKSSGSKLMILDYRDRLTELSGLIQEGISIDKPNTINEIIGYIKRYLTSLCINVDMNEVFDNLRFFVTDVELCYQGKLVNFGNKIGINLEYCEFDENGKFIDFKDEYKDFLKHTFCHEMLHFLSRRENNYSALDDPINEGLTDYFASRIMNTEQFLSNRYMFFTKMMDIMKDIVGEDKLFDTYVNDFPEFSVIKELFNKANVDYSDFYIKCSKLLGLYANKESDDELEKEIINIFKEVISIDISDKNNKDEIISKFNECYKDKDISISSYSK